MNLRTWGLLLLPAACLSLAGCGLPGASSDRIVYANYDDADGFCAQIKDAFAAKAKADGIEVEFLDAKNDGNMLIASFSWSICILPSLFASRNSTSTPSAFAFAAKASLICVQKPSRSS